ncbi:MAG: hypothetical protein ACTSRG_23830 [Candidatus Helarchaeota archaeon]
MISKKFLLAFAHIEHTAGLTLRHILRRNFFMSCFDARPFSKDSQGIFSDYDFKKALNLNPFIRCICGHSVKVHSDLSINFPGIKFMALRYFVWVID